MHAPTTEELANSWEQACQAVEQRRRDLEGAMRTLEKRKEELAKRIAPNDIKAYEAIAVWVRFNKYREVLVVVEMNGAGVFSLTVRGAREKKGAKR